MIAAEMERITHRLPAGYRARPFEDRDREPFLVERNAWYGPMEQADADDWRGWERMAPDESLMRITIEDSAGQLAAMAEIGAGFAFRHPDGAQNVGVSVGRGHRHQGLGSALLDVIIEEARRRGAPRVLAAASAAHADALAWATKRGFREIGRRIESYPDLATFDGSPYAERAEEIRRSGIALRTMAEVLEARDPASREEFIRALYDAETPMWEDIPWASPTPHWAYERFRSMAFESDRLIPDASIVAYEGELIAGFTMTGKRQARDAYTWMTGTARGYRGRGLATAMKVDAILRAKAKGLRALFTTNDEPNKAMRGINTKLGYEVLPARVQLEKTLSPS